MVDMMDRFIGTQFTPKVLLHNEAMLPNVNPINKEDDIPTTVAFLNWVKPPAPVAAQEFSRFAANYSRSYDRLFGYGGFLATTALAVSGWWQNFWHGQSITHAQEV